MIRTARDLSLIAVLLLSACTTDRTRRGYLERMAETLRPPERHVIVIPGFGVTRLYDPLTGRYVWGTPRTAMRTRYADDLDLPSTGPARDRLVPRGYVGSRGPVNVGWQLSEALRKYGGYVPGENVHAFAYDWRLSAVDNARELARLADEVSPGAKVDLVTHSAGAMVALAWVKLDGGGERVDRLVLIAPPLRGLVDALRVFIRPERFLRRTFTPDVVASWPSIYELLPENGSFVLGPDGATLPFDAWTAATWPVVTLDVSPDATHLASARSFRTRLAATPTPPTVRQTVIAGDCVPTAVAILRRDDGSLAIHPRELRDGETELAGRLFEPGDGTVPIASASVGNQPLIFCDGHQGLAGDPSVHRSLLRALAHDR